MSFSEEKYFALRNHLQRLIGQVHSREMDKSQAAAESLAIWAQLEAIEKQLAVTREEETKHLENLRRLHKELRRGVGEPEAG